MNPSLSHPQSALLLPVFFLAACLLLASTTSRAQAVTPPAGGPYVISKQVIAGGGARSSGDSYVLTATVAQAAVDPTPAQGGGYRLTGGFHTPRVPSGDALFANGFED